MILSPKTILLAVAIWFSVCGWVLFAWACLRKPYQRGWDDRGDFERDVIRRPPPREGG